MLDRLAAFHRDNPDLPGIGLERLRLQLEPRLPAPAFVAALQSLARLREIALDGAWVRLPSHQVRLTPAEEKLWRGIQPLIAGKERFRPPRVRDVGAIVGVPEAEVRRVFKLLGRLGKVDEVAHDHFFLRETVAEMAETCVGACRQSAERPVHRRRNSAISSTMAARSPSKFLNSSIAMGSRYGAAICAA